MKTINILITISSLFLLTACGWFGGDTQESLAPTEQQQKSGHQVEAVVQKSAADSKLGYIVQSGMNSYDRQQLNHVFDCAVSSQAAAWINAGAGSQFRIIPQPKYNTPDGQQCRKAEIAYTTLLDNKTRKVYSTGCLEQDGSWQLQ